MVERILAQSAGTVGADQVDGMPERLLACMCQRQLDLLPIEEGVCVAAALVALAEIKVTDDSDGEGYVAGG